MRRSLNLWLFILLVIVAAVFGVTLWGELSREINSSPVITFDTQEITISVEDGEEALLQGISASDAEDGDVTDSLVVESISDFLEDGTRQVTYAAFDSSRNVTKATRLLRYSDYHSPQIVLIQELKTVVGTALNLQNCIRVDDVLDGNITNQLRIIESDYNNYMAGEYQVVFQITNSAGDTTEQAFTIECVEKAVTGAPVITLSTYSVNLAVGDSFDPRAYIEEVTGWNEDREALTTADVSVSGEVDTATPGTYTVTYTLRGDGETGTTKLTVVVQ